MSGDPDVFANLRQHMDVINRSAHQPPAELKLTQTEFEEVQATLKTHPSQLMQSRPDEPLSTAAYILGRPIVIVDKAEDSTLWQAKQVRRFVAVQRERADRHGCRVEPPLPEQVEQLLGKLGAPRRDEKQPTNHQETDS